MYTCIRLKKRGLINCHYTLYSIFGSQELRMFRYFVESTFYMSSMILYMHCRPDSSTYCLQLSIH